MGQTMVMHWVILNAKQLLSLIKQIMGWEGEGEGEGVAQKAIGYLQISY